MQTKNKSKKPSYSLMDFLAKEGFDVFTLDVRGFGRSTRPEGHITTAEASEDLNNIVDYILHIRDIQKVNLKDRVSYAVFF